MISSVFGSFEANLSETLRTSGLPADAIRIYSPGVDQLLIKAQADTLTGVRHTPDGLQQLSASIVYMRGSGLVRDDAAHLKVGFTDRSPYSSEYPMPYDGWTTQFKLWPDGTVGRSDFHLDTCTYGVERSATLDDVRERVGEGIAALRLVETVARELDEHHPIRTIQPHRPNATEGSH